MNDIHETTESGDVGARHTVPLDLTRITRITYNHHTGAYVLFDNFDIAGERVHGPKDDEKPSPRWQAIADLVVDWARDDSSDSHVVTYTRPAAAEPAAAPQSVAAPATKPLDPLDNIDTFYYHADGSYHLERAEVIVEVIRKPVDPDSEEAAAWNDITDARIDGEWVASQVVYGLGIKHVRRGAAVVPPPPEPVEPKSPYIAPEPAKDRLVVKTLVQNLRYPEKLELADQELADYINAGWRVAHEQIVGDEALTLRYIRLIRREPAPATNGHRTSATVGIPPARITIHPTPVDLSHFPIANAIREHGKAEVMDILNQQVADTARAAFEQRLNQHDLRARTRIPLLT